MTRSFRSSIREYVAQPDERHERNQLRGGAAEPNRAAVPPRCELQPRAGVDGHGIRLHAAYIADRDAGAARLQHAADALTQPGEVVAADRPADGERDRLRRRG